MPRSSLPPDLTPFAFTTAEARAAGVGRGRLRGSDVDHPHHGVHVLRSEHDDIRTRCERIRPALRSEHWFSHLTAARIWGMPLPDPYDPIEGLHVMAVGSRVPLRHSGTVGWITADRLIEREMVGDIPVLSPAAVWCQLAVRGAVHARETLPYEWLVAAGDFLITGPRRGGGRRGPALCSLAMLQAAVARRRSARGAVVLARALGDLRQPVDSPRETLLRLGLVAAGLPEPLVQMPVMTSDGLKHADLGYPRARLLLEYQGDEHRASRRRWLEDLTRVQLFEDAGYRVILVGAHDIEPDCTALAARVRRALQRG